MALAMDEVINERLGIATCRNLLEPLDHLADTRTFSQKALTQKPLAALELIDASTLLAADADELTAWHVPKVDAITFVVVLSLCLLMAPDTLLEASNLRRKGG